ncbi:MAG: DUF2914 domain-containing protein [bacterium]
MVEVVLPIKYPRHRTWNYKTFLPEWGGKWSVEILDEAEDRLDFVAFEIAKVMKENVE